MLVAGPLRTPRSTTHQAAPALVTVPAGFTTPPTAPLGPYRALLPCLSAAYLTYTPYNWAGKREYRVYWPSAGIVKTSMASTLSLDTWYACSVVAVGVEVVV